MLFEVDWIAFVSSLPMQRFFNDFDSLDRFTLSLDCFDETLRCPHCSKNHQLVSHGVIYKQRSIDKREAVGKRVFCSNRHGRSGCGRTVQLYVAQGIPAMQYGAAHLFVFLSSLFVGLAVETAYRKATGQSASRHGWRWLSKLTRSLTDFRGFLKRRPAPVTPRFQVRSRRLQLLLPTLEKLFARLPHCPCLNYQLACQRAFI